MESNISFCATVNQFFQSPTSPENDIRHRSNRIPYAFKSCTFCENLIHNVYNNLQLTYISLFLCMFNSIDLSHYLLYLFCTFHGFCLSTSMRFRFCSSLVAFYRPGRGCLHFGQSHPQHLSPGMPPVL